MNFIIDVYVPGQCGQRIFVNFRRSRFGIVLQLEHSFSYLNAYIAQPTCSHRTMRHGIPSWCLRDLFEMKKVLEIARIKHAFSYSNSFLSFPGFLRYQQINTFGSHWFSNYENYMEWSFSISSFEIYWIKNSLWIVKTKVLLLHRRKRIQICPIQIIFVIESTEDFKLSANWMGLEWSM